MEGRKQLELTGFMFDSGSKCACLNNKDRRPPKASTHEKGKRDSVPAVYSSAVSTAPGEVLRFQVACFAWWRGRTNPMTSRV